MVVRPNSRSLAVSQGKGLDLDAAKASGLMESIELHHAERIMSPLLLATFNEMRFGRKVADPTRLARLSISSFHANHRLLWIEGADLIGGVPTWVPYETVHTNYLLPLPPGSGSFVMSSNGLASGNNLLEAIVHGVCEVIERDATTLWVIQGGESRDETRVRLDTVEDPACRRVLDAYEAAGIAAGAWDTTTDLGVPSFFAAIADRRATVFRQLYVTHGAGCHPTREIALLRALTEAAQSRLTLISGSRDDADRNVFERARNPDNVARFVERIETRKAERRFGDIATAEHDTFEDDLGFLLGRLRARAIEQAIAVDLGKPELGVAVVRVVIPGLEAFHEVPGWVPGDRARTVLERKK